VHSLDRLYLSIDVFLIHQGNQRVVGAEAFDDVQYRSAIIENAVRGDAAQERLENVYL